jgi:hypothetical protein
MGDHCKSHKPKGPRVLILHIGSIAQNPAFIAKKEEPGFDTPGFWFYAFFYLVT